MSKNSTQQGASSGGTSPGTAAILSFLMPGVGHIVGGDKSRGIKFLVAWVSILVVGLLTVKVVIGFFILLLNVLLHVYATIDAHKRIKKINAGEIQPE